MAHILVRNLDEQVVAALRRKAELHGHSLEQELRVALTSAARLTPAERMALARRQHKPDPARSRFAMTLVVDASVACKWFVAESGSDAAEALLGEVGLLLAPDLIVPEVCKAAWSTLRRGEIGAEQAAAMVEGLPVLLDELAPSAPLAGRALAIANTLAHPAL
jgi:predicted nucleic acid-binding protein/plasmid stability protein